MKYAICAKNGAKPSYIHELIGLSLEPKNDHLMEKKENALAKTKTKNCCNTREMNSI